MAEPFPAAAEAAFAIFLAYRDGKLPLTRKAGSFLGELVVGDAPLSEKQTAWLQTLLVKAALPPLKVEGSAHA